MTPEFMQQLMIFLGVVVTTSGATWGAIAVANRARKSTDQGTVAEFAKSVVERVETLEGKVQFLEDHIKVQDRIIRTLGTFVDRVGLWLASDFRGARPAPPTSIREYIDADLWHPSQEGSPE